MNTKILATLAAASLLAAGCAQLTRGDGKTVSTPPDPRIKCAVDHPVCHITVRVKDCKVTVEPDEKHVAYRPGGATMLWTIRDSPGVGFARNGITFKPSQVADARRVFTLDERTLVSATLSMHNNTTPGKFPYTVHVVDNGKRCDPHDPGIVNEM
jgi:hypothetical protein